MSEQPAHESAAPRSPHPVATLVRQASGYFRHLGMDIVELEAGRSLIRLHLRPELTNSSGSMHGGAIASLIDSAGGLAARTLTHPMPVTTVEFKVNFLAPFRHGTLLAEGQVIHSGRRTLVTEVMARDEDGRAVACGLVTLTVATSGQAERDRHETPTAGR
jgi:uncharacterized protein (TIGR00369 family)